VHEPGGGHECPRPFSPFGDGAQPHVDPAGAGAGLEVAQVLHQREPDLQAARERGTSAFLGRRPRLEAHQAVAGMPGAEMDHPRVVDIG
jgi:hypothetical protein